MTTLTWPDEVPAGTTWVRHAACRRTFPLSTIGVDGAGKLLCEFCEADEPGAGYGFVAIRRPAVADLLPEPLASAYTPLPHALWDHGHRLGLDKNAKLVIGALWRHQYGKPQAYPGVDLLAVETGLGEKTVRLTTSALSRRGLLIVERVGKKATNRYDLTPLWEALAALASGRRDRSPDDRADPAVNGRCDRSRAVVVTDHRAVVVTAEVEPPGRESQEKESLPPVGPPPASRGRQSGSAGILGSAPADRCHLQCVRGGAARRRLSHEHRVGEDLLRRDDRPGSHARRRTRRAPRAQARRRNPRDGGRCRLTASTPTISSGLPISSPSGSQRALTPTSDRRPASSSTRRPSRAGSASIVRGSTSTLTSSAWCGSGAARRHVCDSSTIASPRR